MSTDLLDEVPDVMRHLSAPPAHHVEVLVGVHKLPPATSSTELRLPHQIKLREQRQRPVDGRQVHTRTAALDALGDLLDGQVLIGSAKHLPHRLPREGHPVTTPA